MSKELNQSFAQRSQSSGAAIQLEVRVLQNGSWPFKVDRKLNLPQQLATQLERFKSFYNEKHTSRKLKWLYSRSKGDLIMQGKKRFTIKVRLNSDIFQLICATKQSNIIHLSIDNFVQKNWLPFKLLIYSNAFFLGLQANTYQIAILLQYNEQLSYSFRDLAANTGIEMTYLKELVEFLISKKLLQKSSDRAADASIETSNFELNTNYNGLVLMALEFHGICE